MTWAGLMTYCVGAVGISPLTYWQSTLVQVIGYIRHHRKIEEAQYMAGWEQTRWQTAALLSVHTKKGKKIKPKDLIEFHWEKKNTPPAKVLSKEEKFERFNRTDRDFKKWLAEQNGT
jgi:hypothetical protein